MVNIGIHVPYGKGFLELDLPSRIFDIDRFLPGDHFPPVQNALETVNKALSYPIGNLHPFSQFNANTSIAITVNDKTRPVPNTLLLTPLLERLHFLGVKSTNISIFIASGTHIPMSSDEFYLILDPEITNNYRIIPHNCDDYEQLYALGITSRHTPVYVNKSYFHHDIKIVVGDIELHHFAGYSGGVKSAAIGLSGRETINANHKLLMDENSFLGNYDGNPLRMDIEEIGRMMKIDLALNAVLNEKIEILDVFFGDPVEVMRAGIKLVNEICQIKIKSQYDIVITSTGGYPKDINLYQAQKAMTHGSMFCKPGGVLILIAECSEGVGSSGYTEFIRGVNSVEGVIMKFRESEFKVGPHKAYQIARIMQRHQVYVYSSIPAAIIKTLLLKHITSCSQINDIIHSVLPQNGRVAILPYATACIPYIEKGMT